MSAGAQQFSFTARDPAIGSASLAPMLPLAMQAAQSVPVSGLLDMGAAVNVLPYDVGLQLGFTWNELNTTVHLRSRHLFEVNRKA